MATNAPKSDKKSLKSTTSSVRTARPLSAVASPSPAPSPKQGDPTDFRKILDLIWHKFIILFLWLLEICHLVFEYIADILVKIYRIALFCYRKPKHAKELLLTSIHLIKVSYDAEIWSWTDILHVVKAQLIVPMTKAPPEQQKVK